MSHTRKGKLAQRRRREDALTRRQDQLARYIRWVFKRDEYRPNDAEKAISRAEDEITVLRKKLNITTTS